MIPFKKIIPAVRNRLGNYILPKSEWQYFLAKYKNTPRFERGTVKLREYLFETPDVPSVVYQIKETFFDSQLKFETDKTEPIIIDCGANVGITCAYFKHIFPKAQIKAFEADSNIFEYLKKNIEKNGIRDSVELINKAVWTDNNGIEFGMEGADGGSIYKKNSESEKVASVRLKEVLESEKEIDLLKIDIEGAEDAVIADCGESLKRVRRLFFEYHSHKDRRQNLDLILRTLSENNFRYDIQGTKKGSPFARKASKKDSVDLDLQLEIFAVNTKNN